jgi:hypothetical protein
MRVERLCVSEPDKWVEAQEGKPLTVGHIDRIVGDVRDDEGRPVDRESVAYLKPDGRLLFAYLPWRLPYWVTRVTECAVRAAARHSDERRAHSNIAGWFDLPYPRVTYFARTRPNHWHLLHWLLRAMDDAYREAARELAGVLPACPYAAAVAVARETHPSYLVPGTPFTTATCNKNWRSPCHKDDGDLGLSVLTATTESGYDDGLFVLPKWRVGVDVRWRDVLIADLAQEYHGNTPLVLSPVYLDSPAYLSRLAEFGTDVAVGPPSA